MTQKSRSSLQSDISNNLADNSSGNITASIMRGELVDLTDSFYNKTTDTNIASGQICFNLDGGGAAISANTKTDLCIPYNCTINSWDLVADQTGSIQIDIWKQSYSSYPPLVGNSITASAKPIISSSTKAASSTLTGWTTSLSAGDYLRFNVDSCSTITRAILTIKVTRS